LKEERGQGRTGSGTTGLVTGEAGSGKTKVCRKVAAALHPGLYRVFYVPLSTGNVMDLYKSIG
jgi:general secretion pathway protein A